MWWTQRICLWTKNCIKKLVLWTSFSSIIIFLKLHKVNGVVYSLCLMIYCLCCFSTILVQWLYPLARSSYLFNGKEKCNAISSHHSDPFWIYYRQSYLAFARVLFHNLNPHLRSHMITLIGVPNGQQSPLLNMFSVFNLFLKLSL